MRIINVSNPAAFGAEWTQGGSTYQAVNSLGSNNVFLYLKRADGTWYPWGGALANPERFGWTGPAATWAQFRDFVTAFVAAGTESEESTDA